MKPTQKQIDQFLGHNHIALAGYSNNPRKFGHLVYRTLTQNGYQVEAINPKGGVIIGSEKPIYTSVMQLPGDIKALLVVTKQDQTLKVLQDAQQKGIGHIWIQQMSETPELKSLAKEDPQLIVGQCILMYVNPKGIHKFHHFLAGLFGLLPR